MSVKVKGERLQSRAVDGIEHSFHEGEPLSRLCVNITVFDVAFLLYIVPYRRFFLVLENEENIETA